MNKVYLVLHESYGEYDNCYETSVYLFEKYEDGLFYLDEVKQKTIEEFSYDANEDIGRCIEIDERKNYFYIYLEEFGWDRLILEEYDILKF